MFYIGFDLGTYLLRFVLAKKTNGKLDVVKSHTMVINFGMMEHGKAMPNAAVQRLTRAFEKFSSYYQKPEYKIRCVATAAFRFSPSSDKIIKEIYDQFKIKIEVINAKEEIFLSAIGCADYIKSEAIIVDIGSGSTEIAYVSNNNGNIEIKDYTSLDLGLINNLASAAKRAIEFEKLSKFVEKHPALPVICSKCNTLKIAYNYLHNQNLSIIDGRKFLISDLRSALIQLSQIKNDELKKMPSIGSKKIRLIKIGLPWIYEIFKHIKCKEVILSESGLKEGVVLDLMKKHPHKQSNSKKISAPQTKPSTNKWRQKIKYALRPKVKNEAA